MGRRFAPLHLLVVFLSLVSGCSTTPVWRNEFDSARDFDADFRECSTLVHTTKITTPIFTGNALENLFEILTAPEVEVTDYSKRDLCLGSRGWSQTSTPSRSSTPMPDWYHTPTPSRSSTPTPSPSSSEPTFKTKDACPGGQYWNSTRGQCERLGS
jgi:hypothetical protein